LGHGKRKDHTVFAPWDYIYQIARSQKLSIAELLDRAVSQYEMNNVTSVRELDQFRDDLRGRIKLMKFRIGSTRPTDLDLSILDMYQDMLEESDSLIPKDP
jgi:hypothetical protein